MDALVAAVAEAIKTAGYSDYSDPYECGPEIVKNIADVFDSLIDGFDRDAFLAASADNGPRMTWETER